MHKNNVINLNEFRPLKQTQRKIDPCPVVQDFNSEKSFIFDMTERRKEIINQERREVKRTILTGFVGAFVVVPKRGLLKVDIYDISEDGISFDLEMSAGQFKRNEEVAMRVYLNNYTYFTFTTQIQNVRALRDEGLLRHGAQFVKNTYNEQALHHFVKFIETVSLSIEKDVGDLKVSKS